MAFTYLEGFIFGLMMGLVVGTSISFMAMKNPDFASKEKESLRTQFDHSNKEEERDEVEDLGMDMDDESSVQRASSCLKELMDVKDALDQKSEEVTDINEKVATLRKENLKLHDLMKVLTQDLQTVKLRCISH